MLVESILQNETIKSLRAEGNIFYIRYVDKLKNLQERNKRLSKG